MRLTAETNDRSDQASRDRLDVVTSERESIDDAEDDLALNDDREGPEPFDQRIEADALFNNRGRTVQRRAVARRLRLVAA